MKKLSSGLLVFLFLLPCILNAQGLLNVLPGTGTLNEAIGEYGPSKIYLLSAGEVYYLDATIEHEEGHLHIRGEEPGPGEKPATLRTAHYALDKMFDCRGDISLENLYIMNVDDTGDMGTNLLLNSLYGARIIIDNCVIEPASESSTIVVSGGEEKIYFTNNLVVNMGVLSSPNDGHFFRTGSSSSGAGIDTLYVENNTFVCMGTNMHGGGNNQFEDNFILWNHNTWVNQKSQFNWTNFENELYFTNNLLFNAQTQPWSFDWDKMPGYDEGYHLFGIIYADTLSGEGLPSGRISYVNYNSHYRLPGFYALVNEINSLDDKDTLADAYLQPLVWHEDDFPGTLISRETELFNNDEAFPHWYFEYDLNWKDEDPGWNDPKIYSYADKLLQWTRPATYSHVLQLPEEDPRVGPVNEWTNWHWDPDGDPADNIAWPLFDGSYTSNTMLGASVAALPLGDLNWFPEKKELWEEYQEVIFSHMRDGKTNSLDLGSVYTGREESSTHSRIYPNPMTSGAYLEYELFSPSNVEILLFNSLGQQLSLLQDERRETGKHALRIERGSLSGGLYLIVIRSAGGTESHKLILTGN